MSSSTENDRREPTDPGSPPVAPSARKSNGPGRWLARLAVLVAGIWLAYRAAKSAALAVALPSASGLVALAGWLTTWTLVPMAAIGLACLAIALFRRRWFCRWLCPTGLLLDTTGKLNPPCRTLFVRVPALGPWLAGATLGGALVGLPLFALLDPLALFQSAAHVAVTRALAWPALLGGAGLLVILLLNLAMPGVWCYRLCPLGGLQDLVHLQAKPAQTKRPGWSLRRRGLLAAGAGLAGGWLLKRKAGAATALHPPGAAPAGTFESLCVRCGNCSRVCPAKIIHADTTLQAGSWTAWLTPFVRFEDDYCHEDCAACGQACPSGALRHISIKEKMRGPIGIAKVDIENCLLTDDHECVICRNRCPFDALRAEFSQKEYTAVIKVDAAKCPGCGACEVACPTAPVKAIRVYPLGC